MYLKRLDLIGFKSFPDKVRFDFDKGITAIVGPNGSGKSNISDAVRWVLGEQKIKSLRGDKMEDVIFSGTANRKPIGFAEVSLTIDNEEQRLQIPYSEVTVTRRVFRSGDSNYLINGTECRLKDIFELFMDTGIGREGYSIISQGKIDEIISGKPEDRRRIFEEATGIVKFKSRKNESISKLEKERQNLLRVTDIINELAGREESLKEESEKAKEYLMLFETLKNFEIIIFKNRYEYAENEILNLNSKKEIISEEIENHKATSEDIKDQIKKSGSIVNSLNDKIQELNEEITNLSLKKESFEGNIKRFNDQINNNIRFVEEIEENIKNELVRLEELKSNKQSFENKLIEIKQEKQEEENNLNFLISEYEETIKNITKNEDIVKEYQTKIIENIKKSSDIKEQIIKNKTYLTQKENELKEKAKEKEEELKNSEDIKKEILYYESKIKDYTDEKDIIIKNINVFTSKKDELVKIKDKLSEEINVYEKELAEKESRLSLLKEMEYEHEGFFNSVKNILLEKSKNNPDFRGVCGAVGELVYVEKKYETAIEIALGDGIQHIVTENENDAKVSIKYLKEKKLGRATFLPLTTVRKRERNFEFDKLILKEGVLGSAKNLITYDKKYENVFSSLLEKILIVDNLENGLKLSKEINQKYKIVTLSGEVLSTSGSITGGSVSKKTTNIFARTREISEISSYIAELKEKLIKKQNELVEKKESLGDILISLEECSKEQNDIDILLLTGNEKLASFKNLYLEKETKIKSFDSTRIKIEDDIKTFSSKITCLNDNLNNNEKEIKLLEEKISKFTSDVDFDKTGRDELNNIITQKKVRINDLENNIDILNKDIYNSEEIINSILIKNEEAKKKKVSAVEFLNNKNEEITKIKDEIINLDQKSKFCKEEISNLIEKRNDINLKTESLSSQAEENYRNISMLENDLYRIISKTENLTREKEYIVNSIWENYEITYEDVKNTETDISQRKAESEAKSIKQKIKNLGNINVNSIEEYKEVKERLDFLSEQRDDILETEEKLEKLIKELSTMMKDKFRAEFSKISDSFNQVFSELFGGGKAYLSLENEIDILNSNIEIVVQPPGKKLQNMQLLSGGEKALTAISLLFSILKLKPSPFCILDEIEASLDDANVTRYSDFLKKLSNDTQFIVITHRKGTMEAADVMYGITMQEQGISKPVSVDLK